MGLLDDHLQVDNTKLGNDVLFYDQHVSQLLGDLYGDDFRVPYQLKDIGIDIREEKGLKREYVADKLGISPDHLSAIERGSTPADLIKVKKLSIIYNLEPKWFLE